MSDIPVTLNTETSVAFLAGAVCALTVVRWVMKMRNNGWSWRPPKKGDDDE